MKTWDEQGGAAFPSSSEGEYGMSLRDYFAAQAIIALAMRPDDCNLIRDANVAYDIADAMLAARSRP